jgi:hypothetical protein
MLCCHNMTVKPWSFLHICVDSVEFDVTSDSRTGKPIACRILKLEHGSVTFEVSISL